jgi:dTDP-4-dehydrorhamnose 3,5-epimerase
MKSLINEFCVNDVAIINLESHQDDRGELIRSYCDNFLQDKNIKFNIRQGNISINKKKYTLRGFHYQKEPSIESKLISVLNGKIFNVILDLRKKSKTFQNKIIFELDAKNKQCLYVPAGCANAYLTMEENTIINYYMGDFFKPDLYDGIRYNDPYFKVEWPQEPLVISKKDLSYANYIYE